MAQESFIKRDSKVMQNTAEILKAIAHPDRLAILQMLSKNHKDGLSVKAIYEKLGLQQPIVSRHLNILKIGGLVLRLQKGSRVSYCLRDDKLNVGKLLSCFTDLVSVDKSNWS